MVRGVSGVLVGLVVAWAGVFATSAVTLWTLGPDRVFAPGMWTHSTTYLLVTLATGFVAALAGGVACELVARDRRAAGALAGVIIVLGIITGAAAVRGGAGAGPAPAREAGTNWQDVRSAYRQGWVRTPEWLLVVNPLVGAAGVLVGALLVPRRGARRGVRGVPEESGARGGR